MHRVLKQFQGESVAAATFAKDPFRVACLLAFPHWHTKLEQGHKDILEVCGFHTVLILLHDLVWRMLQ